MHAVRRETLAGGANWIGGQAVDAAAEHRRFWWRAAEARPDDGWQHGSPAPQHGVPAPLALPPRPLAVEPTMAAAIEPPEALEPADLDIPPHPGDPYALRIGEAGRTPIPSSTALRRNRRPAIVLAVAGLLGIGLFAVLSKGGSVVNAATPIGEQVDQMLVRVGFGVNEVRLSGHRYTVDNDVFGALELTRTGSLLWFDPEIARQNIEQLPWVASASVIRHFPDTVAVVVRERNPIALWQHEGRQALVDATGRVLARVPANTLPELPRISGAGAPDAAAAILATLTAFPTLAAKAERLTRMGQRRWTLRLAGDVDVHLPAHGESEAIARWQRALAADPRKFERARSIDLRMAGRIVLSPVQSLPPQSSAIARPARSASAL